MYILDYHRQLSLIREMTQLRKDSDEWVVYYHHPSTNEMWKSYFPRATKEHRGPKILRTEPVPERLEDRFKECLTGEVEENAIGLGIELSVEPQRWEEIISVIEKHYREYDRKLLKLFLKYLGVESYRSLFDELGLSIQQQGLDKDTLKKLSRRSKIIRFKRFWFF
ncbi:MAG: hypothetical protein R3350_08480 [Saprospiraceae bacterium]|nr:hypothetical protein [Saprospiraceae bacterium]